MVAIVSGRRFPAALDPSGPGSGRTWAKGAATEGHRADPKPGGAQLLPITRASGGEGRQMTSE